VHSYTMSDDIAYIPVDWAQALFNREGLMEIHVVFGPGIASAPMAERVRALLIERTPGGLQPELAASHSRHPAGTRQRC